MVSQSTVQKTNTGSRVERPSGQETEKLFHKLQEKTSKLCNSMLICSGPESQEAQIHSVFERKHQQEKSSLS